MLGIGVARVWLALVALGIFLLLVPEPEKSPLVSSQGWVCQGFHPAAPQSNPQLSRQVARSPELVLWRSWSPVAKSQPGLLESPAFDPPQFIAVPVAGYPAFRDLAAYLECVGTGRRLPLTAGNPHEDWYERTIRLPGGWCRDQVKLVAISLSTDRYVGVGTPFRSSLIAYLKESAPVLLLVHALNFALIVCPGWVIATWAGSRTIAVVPVSIAAIPLTGLLGYACFFLGYYCGAVASTALSVAVLAAVPVAWRRQRAVPLDVDLVLPLGLTFIYSLFCVLLLYAPDGGAGTWTATYRYWPAIWSSDNQLQQRVAEQMYQGGPLTGLLQPWRVSDRPPLMAGTLLMLRALWQPFLGAEGSERLLFYFHQTAGIVLNSCWIPGVWFLLRRLRLSARETAAAIALVGCTGFTLFNTTYIWPKLIGGALALIGYALLVRVDPGERRIGLGAWGWIGLCMALSLVSHGGVVFGLLALVPMVAKAALRSTPWHVVTAALVSGFILVPWMVWQQTADPPGNALVKFAFAGTWGFGEEDVGVWATVARAYRSITPTEWLSVRLQALRAIMGWHIDPQVAWVTRVQGADTFLGGLRLADFLFLGPSLRFLNVGWVALAASRWWLPSQRNRLMLLRSMAALGVAGVAVSVVMLWRQSVVHTLSYLSILLIETSLAAAIVSVGRSLCLAALACQVVYFAVVWVLDPLLWASTAPLDVAAAIVLPGAAALRLWLLVDARQAGSDESAARP